MIPSKILHKFNGENEDKLLILYNPSDYKSDGAHFWDWLISDSIHWKELKYNYIGDSVYGDQIIITNNSPIHEGQAIYLRGPDVAGPKSENKAWPENVLYLSPSIDAWIERLEKYGDEHSIGPGGIDRELGLLSNQYKQLYRNLNPGLSW